MKNNYRIDIILPVYNSKDFILSTLESVTKQTYKNWRLLIVDDNSDDGTRELIIGCIKNCKENELDAESLKKYGTCEQQADAIFDGKLSINIEKEFGQALIKNFKTSLPVGIDKGNPYNLNFIPEDYKNAVMVLSWLGAWTNYDDLLAGTYNTAESFYNRLNDNTEKEQKLVSDRIKCLDLLKGIKEMTPKNKALASVAFEKCIAKTITKKSDLPSTDGTQTDTTKTVQTDTITPQPQPSGVYEPNEKSFIEFLKNQSPPETYKEGSYNKDAWVGKNSDNKKYYYNKEKKIFD